MARKTLTRKAKREPKPKLAIEAIRRLKPRDEPFKQRFDGARGLHMQVQPNGSKLWRLDVWFESRALLLALGSWPDVSIEAALKAAADAKAAAASGLDPRGIRGAAVQTTFAKDETFGAFADAHIRRMSERAKPKAAATIKKRKWLLGYPEERVAGAIVPAVPGLAKALRNRPIASITPQDCLAVLRPLEAEGKLETAKRLKIAMSLVFRRAIVADLIKHDPTAALGDEIESPQVEHLKAIVDGAGFGDLLAAINGYSGGTRGVVRAALQLLALTALRPGELRLSRWGDIDFKSKVWRIDASRQKRRKEHVIPLSARAVEILEGLKERAPHAAADDFIFPSPRSRTRPISDNACNAALRTLGFDNHVAHGFRSSFSSLANESGKWNRDAIERQLSHGDRDTVRSAYNRSPHWKERVEMAEWWARECDRLERRSRLLGSERDWKERESRASQPRRNAADMLA
jgi:integrase